MPDFRNLRDYLASQPPVVPAARNLLDEMLLPGHGGMPPRLDAAEHAQPADQRNWFARLVGGQPLGKFGVFDYDADADVGQVAAVPFFEIGGSDLDSGQMVVTLDAPRVYRAADTDVAAIVGTTGIQNISGGMTNLEVGDANFPGAAAPIAWPPFLCLIEWGTSIRTFALVDFRNGTSFRISGSWARALAVVPEDASNMPGTSAAYILRASIGPGWSHGGNAQRTVNLGSVDASSGSDVFMTPPHATTVTATSSIAPPGITAGYITFCQSPDGTLPIATYYVNANQPGPFPVPNGGMYFFVTDGTGTSVAWSALFGLSL